MATPASNRIPALVGRSRETGNIDRVLGALREGQGQVMMLTGEPGIGKSTLARYASEQAGMLGIPVYWGFAWEAGGAPAYWPWTQLLGSLVSEQQPDAELRASLGQILPGIDEAAPETGLQPNQARFALLEAVRHLLESVSRESPLVLVLEDLHAADSDSLHLLHYIARHAPGMPLLILGTFREAEARAMPAAEPLWRACRDAEVLALERLDEGAVRDYLASLDPSVASQDNVQKLFEATEGNPLFLAELIGLLAGRASGDTPLPATVQQVIRQQIGLLDAPTSDLLTRASVLGREFSIEALAAVSDENEQGMGMGLEEAAKAGLLRVTPRGHYRFSHTLHRDVLYLDSHPAQRARLHLKFSEYLRQRIDAGERDRWAELAEHLHAAGGEHRQQAVAAWRRAAAREMKRLAFDEAAATLGKALQAFGAGPRSEPADRYALLLECAVPALLSGDTETGHRYCRDAFEIARALGDARLMAEAALAWGSTIVVATVNAELIDALRESLAALPEGEVALRARVQARLAGAMQPANNPQEPMDMARAAIALARTTNDENVLHEVLRSAISALMDFAPATERIPLNEEFAALAEQSGDVPGQFRSQLRLMIDSCEAADRDRMDQAVEDCHRLAERIGLPHYRWRAASARAMQATLDGDFERAMALLDAAQRYADQFDDFEARATLPLQRYAILIEWAGYQGETAEQIEARLQEAYAAGMENAEFFVTPFIEHNRAPLDADNARRMLSDRATVQRMQASGDLDTACRLGDLAAAAGESRLAGEILERLQSSQECCATLGLMGSACTGPVALTLGRIASSLERPKEALKWHRKALEVTQAMRSPPWAARVHTAIAAVARNLDDKESALRHDTEARRIIGKLGMRPERGANMGAGADSPAPSTHTDSIALRREGELWKVSWGEESALLRPSKGLAMLAQLLARPDTEIHALDLSGGQAVSGQDDAGPALDDQARHAYEARLHELKEELEEAQEFGDSSRADAAREEMDFITRELSRAFGLGGRSRPSGAAAERARVNVRRRLMDAIERIGEQIPEARRYLKNTVKTGTYCRYLPM